MNIKKRLLPAALIVVLTWGCTLLCKETRVLFYTALAAASVFEMNGILRGAGQAVDKWLLLAYVILQGILCYLGVGAVWLIALFSAVAFGTMLHVILKPALGGAFAAATLFVMVWPFAFYAVILHAAASELWLPTFVIGVLGAWACDSTALVGGKLFGKHKLAPVVSPNKTWEGAIIGGVCAIIAGWLISLILRRFAYVPTLPCVIVTFVVSCIGQVGDLAASLVKRMVGVKDFGHLMPEHGGITDKTDSVLFAIPAAYLGVYIITLL